MKLDRSLIYRVSIVLLIVVSVAVIAIPADTRFKSFSDSVGNALGRDVTMVTSVSVPANEGESLFFPERIEKLLAFNVPKSASSFIFPRDSSFNYKDGFLIVSDKLANELTRVSLGDMVQISFQKTDLNNGTAFKIPKVDKDYFIVAVSESTIRNIFTIGSSAGTGSSKYAFLSPVAVFSDPALASEMISGGAYTSIGDILNDVFSFIYSGGTDIKSRRDELIKKIDKATAITTLDGKIDDKVKNIILAVYANTAGLIESGTKFDDDRYNNLLSGIQVELSNQILRSNKTLEINTKVARQVPRSLIATVGNTSQGTSANTSQSNSVVSPPATINSISARTTSVRIDHPTLIGMPDLTMPAKATVLSAEIPTPCDLTKGYITHFLQDRECTGANIISIPMGVFSLIYNSSKPDDSFYGIQRTKTNFDEYITADLKFYITAQDKKIPLTRSGTSLIPSFVWEVSSFKASGSRYIREERKSGLKYFYAKAGPSDTKYRLVEVQLLDNTKVTGLQYNPILPFNLIAIEYRTKKEERTLRKINFNSGSMTYYGTTGIRLTVDYSDSEDVFKDGDILSFHGTLSSVNIGSDEHYGFNYRGSMGNFYPVAIGYSKRLPDGDYKVNHFFGYDNDGTKIYEESNRFNKNGKKLVKFVNYTYPKLADGHNVNYIDNYNNTGSFQYVNLGWNFLKVKKQTPFGVDIFQYKPPLYTFYRHYSARDKKWDTEVLTYEDNASDIRINNQIKSEREVNGTTTTIIKDINNKEIAKSVIIDRGNGEYASSVFTGAVKQVESRTNVVGSANNFTTATSTEVAGKKESDIRSIVSDSSVQVSDVLKGRTYKELKVGDKVTQTYTEPNQPSYIKETTTSINNRIATTESIEKLGPKIVSKSVSKVLEEPAGTSWVVDNYFPVEGSRKWRQSSSGYDATRKQSVSKESIAPVGGR